MLPVPHAAEQLINSKQLHKEINAPDKPPPTQHTRLSSAFPEYRFSQLGVRLLERFLLGTGTGEIATNVQLSLGLYTRSTNLDTTSKAKIKRF